jgi:hypothetical protein
MPARAGRARGTLDFALMLTTTPIPGTAVVPVHHDGDAADAGRSEGAGAGAGGGHDPDARRVGVSVWMVSHPKGRRAHLSCGVITEWNSKFDVFEHNIPQLDGSSGMACQWSRCASSRASDVSSCCTADWWLCHVTGAAVYSDAGIVGVHYTDGYAVKWKTIADSIVDCAERLGTELVGRKARDACVMFATMSAAMWCTVCGIALRSASGLGVLFALLSL